MNANEIADKLEQGHWEGGTREQAATMLRQQQAEYYSLLVNHDKLYAKVVEQQAEIEALKNGFNTTWAGTNNSEMAEVRAMANRCILKIQELEFEQEGFENLVEMLESEKEELVEKTRQQQAEIEALKAKTLTDDEIADLIKATNDEIGMINIRTFDFVKVLLRKAQEK